MFFINNIAFIQSTKLCTSLTFDMMLAEEIEFCFGIPLCDQNVLESDFNNIDI